MIQKQNKKNKLKRLLSVLLVILSLSSFAQIEVSPMVGYFFGGSTNFYEGSIKIKDNINYGLHLGFDMGHHNGIEFSYSLSPTIAQWRPSFNYNDILPARDFNLNTHTFLLGGLKGIPLANDNMIGFGGFKLGAIMYHPTNSNQVNISDVWRFMVGINAGIKFFINDIVGLRIQGNMYMPLYFNGGGFYCGIGSGGSNCGASVNSTVVIFEGDLSAGLIFKLGQ